MPVRQSRLFLLASMSLAAFAVHELRYQLAFGARAGDALSEQGHAYMQPLCAAIVVLLVCGAAQLMHLVTRGSDPGRTAGASFRRGWLLASIVLVAVFVGQELIEGSVASGHPAGLDGVLGSGGWVALPLAALCGFVVAVAVREVHAAIGRARCWLVLVYAAPAPAGVAVAGQRLGLRVGVLAQHLAGRAPPLVVS